MSENYAETDQVTGWLRPGEGYFSWVLLLLLRYAAKNLAAIEAVAVCYSQLKSQN